MVKAMIEERFLNHMRAPKKFSLEVTGGFWGSKISAQKISF